jgi:uncharacterized membrane protein YfcA
MAFETLVEIVALHWFVILLFFIIAILYSSVGFGGGSSYLAILAIAGIAFTQIRSTALICNIAVVTGNILLYYRKGRYNWKKVLPLALVSVPMAFLGGFLKISQTFFFVLLGFTLLFAAITMWISRSFVSRASSFQRNKPLENIGYGGIIGFISGMVGIGGGIFLAPLLHLRQWDTPKKIAATASFFILVNSISGLAGQILNPNFLIDWSLTGILLITVFIGGQIGGRLSQQYFSPIQLKKATAILIAFVGIKILWNHLVETSLLELLFDF